MRYLLVAITFLFVTNASAGWVDPILANAVERYVVFTGGTAIKSDVVFSEEFMTRMQKVMEDDSILGICTTYKQGIPVIVIDPTSWVTLGEKQQTALIWHELEHCERDVAHNDDSLLMGTRILSEEVLTANWGNLILELL